MLLGAGALVALVSNGRGTEGTKASTSAPGLAPGLVPSGSEDHAAGGGMARSRDLTRMDSTNESTAPTFESTALVGPGVPKLGARVVKHATLDLTVRAGMLKSKFATANGIAGFFGGFVAASEESRGLATVSLRLPSDRFEEALTKLSGLGRVANRSERGDDVTAQFTDLDARLRNLTAQEGVLQDLMRQAKNIPDVISVQQQLSGVREQTEQLTGARNALDDQASFATVALTMRAVGAVPASGTQRSVIGQAWRDAIGVTVAIVGGTIVVLGAVVPLGILLLLGLPVWILIRRRLQTSPAGI